MVNKDVLNPIAKRFVHDHKYITKLTRLKSRCPLCKKYLSPSVSYPSNDLDCVSCKSVYDVSFHSNGYVLHVKGLSR